MCSYAIGIKKSYRIDGTRGSIRGIYRWSVLSEPVVADRSRDLRSVSSSWSVVAPEWLGATSILAHGNVIPRKSTVPPRRSEGSEPFHVLFARTRCLSLPPGGIASLSTALCPTTSVSVGSPGRLIWQPARRRH